MLLLSGDVKLNDLIDDPFEPLQQPLVFHGARLLHAHDRHRLLVDVLADAQHVDHLLGFERLRQVLLVCKDQDGDVLRLVIRQEVEEFVSRVLDAVGSGGVEHENDAFDRGVVVFPDISHFLLTGQVKDLDVDIFNLNVFCVDTNGWSSGYKLIKPHFIENSGFSCSIQAHYH